MNGYEKFGLFTESELNDIKKCELNLEDSSAVPASAVAAGAAGGGAGAAGGAAGALAGSA